MSYLFLAITNMMAPNDFIYFESINQLINQEEKL